MLPGILVRTVYYVQMFEKYLELDSVLAVGHGAVWTWAEIVVQWMLVVWLSGNVPGTVWAPVENICCPVSSDGTGGDLVAEKLADAPLRVTLLALTRLVAELSAYLLAMVGLTLWLVSPRERQCWH